MTNLMWNVSLVFSAIIPGSYIRHYSAVWYDTAALREHRSRSRRDTSASGHPGDATLNLRLHALDRFVKPRTALARSIYAGRKRNLPVMVTRSTGEWETSGRGKLYRGKFQFLAAVKGGIIYGRTAVLPARGNREYKFSFRLDVNEQTLAVMYKWSWC